VNDSLMLSYATVFQQMDCSTFRWLSCSAQQFIHTSLHSDLINRAGSTASHANGAERFRDSAMPATLL
jgi:hypothetical protein